MWGRAVATVVMAVVVAASAQAGEMVVIVHPDRAKGLDSNPLGLSDIVQIYLRQRRFWNDGTTIFPVNREAGSVSRERFAKTVFGAESRSQVAFWNREYFRGVLPPITLASDAAVRRFVAAEPRAIGYIPLDLVDDSVRVAFRFE